MIFSSSLSSVVGQSRAFNTQSRSIQSLIADITAFARRSEPTVIVSIAQGQNEEGRARGSELDWDGVYHTEAEIAKDLCRDSLR